MKGWTPTDITAYNDALEQTVQTQMQTQHSKNPTDYAESIEQAVLEAAEATKAEEISKAGRPQASAKAKELILLRKSLTDEVTVSTRQKEGMKEQDFRRKSTRK